MRSFVLLLLLASASVSLAQTPAWTERIQFNGDFRLRHEYTSKAKYLDTAERHQERFRLRVGLQGQVNENIKAKVRIGGSDSQSPISNNTTMTDNGSKKGLYIDLAAVEWKVCDGTNVNLGKQDNPLRLLGQSQVLYDSDYTPEGASIVSKLKSVPLYYSLAAYTLQERATSSSAPVTTTAEPDSWLKAATVGYKSEAAPGWGYHAALGYHDFSNIYNKSALAPGFSGNSNAGAKYLNDYSVGELVLEVRYSTATMAYAAYADGLNNFTIGKNNQGLQAGVQFQTLNEKAKPVWTVGYAYITMGKDTTVSAVNNSDSANGVDGGISHMGVVSRTVGENVSASLTYYHAKVENSGLPFWTDKGLADLVFSF